MRGVLFVQKGEPILWIDIVLSCAWCMWSLFRRSLRPMRKKSVSTAVRGACGSKRGAYGSLPGADIASGLHARWVGRLLAHPKGAEIAPEYCPFGVGRARIGSGGARRAPLRRKHAPSRRRKPPRWSISDYGPTLCRAIHRYDDAAGRCQQPFCHPDMAEQSAF